MKKFLSCAAAVALSSTLLLCGCADRTESRVARSIIMDTTADLVITADFTDSDVVARSAALNKKIKAYLAEVEGSLSAATEASCIYKFNVAEAGERVEIDKISYEVLSLALEMYEFTDGYYNPAVYYCADLYGFTPDSAYPVTGEGAVNSEYKYPLGKNGLPTEEYIAAFKELAGHFSEVTLSEDDGKYYAEKPADGKVEVGGAIYNLKLDLGGIGKGYAVDAVGAMMAEAGFSYGFFDLGGSSYCVKKSYVNANGKWKMNAVNPRGRGAYAEYEISDESLSTSGDNEKYYEVGGARYCHIIDPTTGSPIKTDIAAVTVIGGGAAEDDALTTALSCMGKEKAVKFINEKLADRKVIFVYAAGVKMEAVTNSPDYFTVTGEGFAVVNISETGTVDVG